MKKIWRSLISLLRKDIGKKLSKFRGRRRRRSLRGKRDKQSLAMLLRLKTFIRRTHNDI